MKKLKKDGCEPGQTAFESWLCEVCQQVLPAPNELTFHYISHSILELALGK
jgi:hypothetical protein